METIKEQAGEIVSVDINDENMRGAFAPDKMAHLFAGACIALACSSFAYANLPKLNLRGKIILAAAVAVSAGIAIGYLKEMKDLYDDDVISVYDIEDFYYTCYGSAAGAAVGVGINSIILSIGASTVTGLIILGILSAVCGFTMIQFARS